MDDNNNNNTHPLRQLNKSSHKISKPSPSPLRLPSPPPPEPPQQPPQPQPPTSPQNPNPNQPPVYNISKADFRDVVQKLTGSPSHDHLRPLLPPPPKPPSSSSSSRLHRIRPPPLIQISPPPPLFRPPNPLSPLPPLPSCHAPAESPISSYMRFLHSSLDPSNTSQNHPPPPSSPLSFGCFPSPKSPSPLLSSNVLFSPTGNGNVPPLPSPRWNNL